MQALGLLVLLWAILTGRGGSRHHRGQQPGPKPLPGPSPSPAPSPSPWPQVLPAGLPAFPGTGWEYDEPPPKAVQQRAGQLVAQLWKQGVGSFKIEQTAGRWIAYRAAITAGKHHGVVAFRQRAAAALPASPRPPVAARPRPAVPARAVPAAAVPGSPMALPVLRQGVGMPPAAPVREVVLLQQKLGLSPADGRFGGNTDAAVRLYQRNHKLAVDGVVGKDTWASLFGPEGGAFRGAGASGEW